MAEHDVIEEETTGSCDDVVVVTVVVTGVVALGLLKSVVSLTDAVGDLGRDRQCFSQLVS